MGPEGGWREARGRLEGPWGGSLAATRAPVCVQMCFPCVHMWLPVPLGGPGHMSFPTCVCMHTNYVCMWKH